jgi:hypothetical protein
MLEVAMREAKITNNLAQDMLNSSTSLSSLRPAGSRPQTAATPAATASPATGASASPAASPADGGAATPASNTNATNSSK